MPVAVVMDDLSLFREHGSKVTYEPAIVSEGFYTHVENAPRRVDGGITRINVTTKGEVTATFVSDGYKVVFPAGSHADLLIYRGNYTIALDSREAIPNIVGGKRRRTQRHRRRRHQSRRRRN